jgi:hypothetical protein
VYCCSFICKEEEGGRRGERGEGRGGGKKKGTIENALLEFHFSLEPLTDQQFQVLSTQTTTILYFLKRNSISVSIFFGFSP